MSRRGDGFFGEQGIEDLPHVRTGHGHIVARSRAIELSAIDAALAGIKNAEVGGACRCIGPRHVLALVIEVGKPKVQFLGQRLHVFGAVHGIACDVVAGDGDEVDPARHVFLGKGHELREDVHHKRAVVAHKYDHGWTCLHQFTAVAQRPGPGVGKGKVGGGEAQRDVCGRGARHGSGFSDELRLEGHGPEAVDAARNIVVAVHESNLADFGSCLHGLGRAFDRQVFDHDHVVAILKDVPIGILYRFCPGFSLGLGLRTGWTPCVSAFWTHQERPIGIGIEGTNIEGKEAVRSWGSVLDEDAVRYAGPDGVCQGQDVAPLGRDVGQAEGDAVGALSKTPGCTSCPREAGEAPMRTMMDARWQCGASPAGGVGVDRQAACAHSCTPSLMTGPRK